jgi:MFS family permease
MKHTNSDRDPYASLRYPEFRSLVVATFTLTVALLAQEIAIGYELYRITRDPFALGMIGLVEAIPFISFSLFGGHIADRAGKRKILLWSVGCIGAASAVLQIASRRQEHLSGSVLLFVIYGAIFVIGLCRAFQSPTANSLRGILVPVALFENAATWSSSAWQVGAIIGPMLSGFSYAWFGFSNTLLIVVVMIIAAFFFYRNIGETPISVSNRDTDIMASIKHGIRFVFKSRIILYSISLDLFSVLFGGVVAILPIYADDILHVGAEGLGVLRSAPSIGAIITVLVLMRISPMVHAWRNLLLAVTGFGISILVFAVSPWMTVSVLALFLSGAFDSISVVIRATILQVMAPDEMRGRVMAINGIFLASSNEVGAFESGLAAKLMGTVPSAVFGGIMTLFIVAWIHGRTRDLRKIAMRQS